MKNFEIQCFLHFESITMNTTVISFVFPERLTPWDKHMH